MRFLLSRRWVLFALAVILLAWLATLLGQWQFHRLDDRRAENKLVAKNLHAPPRPVEKVLSVGKAPSPDDEWRRASVTGTWDDKNSVVVKYQTRDGQAGVEVVTPLVTADGTGVLIDRGWLATSNSGGTRPELPEVTGGKVTVTGWVRADATGSSTRVSELSTRAVSSVEIAKVLDYEVYGGWLDLAKESPTPKVALGDIELPDDNSEGPHFFYGLQWWFFASLAIFGFCYLVYDEWRRARESRSKGAQHPAVDREHDPADK